MNGALWPPEEWPQEPDQQPPQPPQPPSPSEAADPAQQWPWVLLRQPYGHEEEDAPHALMHYQTWLRRLIAASAQAQQRPLVRQVELTEAENAQINASGRRQLRAQRQAFWRAMHELGFFCVHEMFLVGDDGQDVWVNGHAGPRAHELEVAGAPEALLPHILLEQLLPSFPSLN